MGKTRGGLRRKAAAAVVSATLALGLCPAAAFAGELDAGVPQGSFDSYVEVQATKVTPPTVPSEVWYQGQQITIARDGTGYTLNGTTSATKLGTYTFTATLKSGYQWSDGTTAAKKYTWKIVNGGIVMHRLYNHWTGEHFYTSDAAEKNKLVSLGWTYEGEGWRASAKGDAVYRLYNQWTGEHHFTLNASEKNACVAAGWTDEGVGWRSYSANGKPYTAAVSVHREYNPYAPAFYHNYTKDANEHNNLCRLGWKDEGVGWYGYPQG